MSKRIINSILVVLFLVLFVSCSQPERKEVLSPSFLNLSSTQTTNTGRAIVVKPEKMEQILFQGYTPAVSGFEKRYISSGDSYEVSILDATIPITFEEKQNDILFFSGKTDDDGIYVSTSYSPKDNSYDYIQAITAQPDPSMSAGGWTDRFSVVKGDSISIDENGISHGKIRHYFLDVYVDGSKALGIGEGEFFSNELVSGIVVKSILNFMSYDYGEHQYDTNIANLEPTIAGIDAITTLGNELYDANSENVGDKYAIVYFDKQNQSIELFGMDWSGHFDDTKTKEDIKAKASEISGGEWTFLL